MLRRFSILALLAAAGFLMRAQGVTCSPTNPCNVVSVTSPAMAAAVTLNSVGVQTSGPGYSKIQKCIGTATQCAASTLGTSVWTTLSGGASSGCPAGTAGVSCTMAQTAATVSFADLAAYSQTVNYAITLTWTGAQGGVASSPILCSGTMPAPAAGAPPAPTATVAAKTSGTYSN